MNLDNLEFQVKALIVAFAITVITTAILTPMFKRKNVDDDEREDGPETHLKKKGTPTMGGIAFIVSLVIIVAGIFVYYRVKEPTIAFNLLAVGLATVGFGIIGFIDDFKKTKYKNKDGLSPKAKMIGLGLISVVFALYLGIYKGTTGLIIPFTGGFEWISPIWFFIPFAIFVMLGSTNAVNLTDGVDGLASSVSTIMFTALTVIAVILQVKEMAIFGGIMVGICIGFLVFNYYPSKMMMGDTGSLLLGGAAAAMALYLKVPLFLLLIAIIPVLEALSVIIQVSHYKRTKKRIFKMAPLHHHFELSGWHENVVVLVFSLVTLAFSILSIFAII